MEETEMEENASQTSCNAETMPASEIEDCLQSERAGDDEENAILNQETNESVNSTRVDLSRAMGIAEDDIEDEDEGKIERISEESHEVLNEDDSDNNKVLSEEDFIAEIAQMQFSNVLLIEKLEQVEEAEGRLNKEIIELQKQLIKQRKENDELKKEMSSKKSSYSQCND